MTLKQKIETLLFISPKPLTAKAIFSLLKHEPEPPELTFIEQTLVQIQTEYNAGERGMQIVESAGSYQMVSHPDAAALIKQFLKEERTGELTPPSLETLTIVAYRSPISRPHIEQIRGVNCAIILRNLMIRGLVNSEDIQGEPFYSVTTEFLQYVGVASVSELPDYEKLHSVENLDEFLTRQASSGEKLAEVSQPEV